MMMRTDGAIRSVGINCVCACRTRPANNMLSERDRGVLV
jgi:hypothetical protein